MDTVPDTALPQEISGVSEMLSVFISSKSNMSAPTPQPLLYTPFSSPNSHAAQGLKENSQILLGKPCMLLFISLM